MMIPRALQKGMLGIGQASLAPSLAALGPNRYLKEKDFFVMLGVAFAVHLTVILILGLTPHEKVTDIPVRALSFKIGGQDRIAAYGAAGGIGTTISAPVPAPAIEPATTSSWRATPQQQTVTPAPLKPIAPKKVLVPMVPPAQRQMPMENRADTLPPLESLPAPQPVLTAPIPLPAPAIAPTPQRFVREVGSAPVGAQANTGIGTASGAIGGQGLESTMTAGTAQQIRERYEQQISTWIQQHKIYPTAAAGAEGRAVVRMRIDRAGYVRYYAVEQSSGNSVLDAAAIDMIRRANPVPAVPVTYPAGNLIEFLIPITFRVPQ